jgi:methylated-DNA-[protein]-cysteine S-methyltransferase
MIYSAIVEAPFGALGVVCDENAVTALDFILDETPESVSSPSALGTAAAKQLAAYLKNPAHPFDLPVAPCGSPYSLRVWDAQTYGALAKHLASGPRAVGNACRRNPIPILIPCHRVVKTSGQGGFMGASQGRCTEVKAWLLAHESRAFG